MLFDDGRFHQSHAMFLDLDDMVRWCTACGATHETTAGIEKLKRPCPGKRPEDPPGEGRPWP